MDYESLWQNYKQKNDIESKGLLIEKYIELVKVISGRLFSTYGTNVEYDDLVSYGIFGLIDAIEKYDLEKNVKFETYAQIRIRGAIIDQLRNLDWIPRSVRQKSKLIDEAYSKLENRFGRSAMDHEVAKELNMSVQEMQNVLQQINSFNVISLEEKILDGSIGNTFKTDGDDLPENIVCRQEISDSLQKNIESLPKREQQVISLYYYEELTYKEIGQILSISESRVSQLHSKAISRLKGKLSCI